MEKYKTKYNIRSHIRLSKHKNYMFCKAFRSSLIYNNLDSENEKHSQSKAKQSKQQHLRGIYSLDHKLCITFLILFILIFSTPTQYHLHFFHHVPLSPSKVTEETFPTLPNLLSSISSDTVDAKF